MEAAAAAAAAADLSPIAASASPPPQEDSPAPSPSPSPAASPAKKSAWKRPSSDSAVDAATAAPAIPVMDADLWPALSESAKAKPSPSSESPKPPDSSPAAAVSSGAVNSSASLKPNSTTTYAHNSAPHLAGHGRQKPEKRGAHAHPSPPVSPAAHRQPGSSAEHSPRDHPERNAGGWDHGSGRAGKLSPQAHGSGSSQRGHNNGGNRRGNNNGGGGGGGPHHGGFGGRRGGQGRGGFDGFYRGPPGARELHPPQPHMGIGSYMRGSPPPPPPLAVAQPFISPPPPPVPPVRAFAGPMVFHEVPSPVSPVSPLYYVGPPPPPESLRGLAAFVPPIVGPSAYPYMPSPLDADRERLLSQIEYYFSTDNLCKDTFLRENMDEQGWVDISLIATFKKVREITASIPYIMESIPYIMETVQSSTMLETQGDKIRKHNDWKIWLLPRPNSRNIPSGPLSPATPNVNNLTAHLGTVGLGASTSSSSMVEQNHGEVVLNGSTSGNINNQVQAVEDHDDDTSHDTTH